MEFTGDQSKTHNCIFAEQGFKSKEQAEKKGEEKMLELGKAREELRRIPLTITVFSVGDLGSHKIE